MADPIAGVILAFSRQMQAATDATRGLQAQVLNFAAATAKATTALTALGASGLEGGFTVLGQTVRYFTSVIGAVAAPVFVATSAAVLTVAEAFRGPMMTATQAVAKVMNDLIPVVGNLMDAMGRAVNFLTERAKEAKEGIFDPWWAAFKHFWGFQAQREGGALQPLAKAIQGVVPGVNADGRQAQAQANAPGQEGGGFVGAFVRNLDKVIQALQVEMNRGGTGGFSDLADVHRQVQMKAFQSELQAQQRKQFEDLMNLLREWQADLHRILGGLQPAVGR
jgi:hypothetical protein